MNTKEILNYDKGHVWHPYASMRNPIPPYVVDSASGVHLRLADGRELIDGMSSWWAVVHGYNNAVMNEAVKLQLEKMSHVMFGGLTHEPAVSLAKRLVEITPKRLDKVFFCDSGSVSVEVAMKMALQYWRARGLKSKSRFATARGGYHGDTWNAMSVCDPVNGMHGLFTGALAPQFFAPRPFTRFGGTWDDSDFSPMRELLYSHRDEIAAVIIEPIVQGAGGMWFYHPKYLSLLREACDEMGILLILDEIATGFGRAGEMFAENYAGVEADIMCLGKALTGGYMSFAATLASDDVACTISDGEPGLFMHGPTFMANPLACAAANASLDLILNGDTIAKVRRIQGKLEEGLNPLISRNSVSDVRVLGAIGVVQTKEPVDIKGVQERLVECGVWLRPFGHLIYTMPAYISSDSDIEKICAAIGEALD